MAKYASVASASREIEDTGIVAPREDTGVGNIILKVVARPAHIAQLGNLAYTSSQRRAETQSKSANQAVKGEDDAKTRNTIQTLPD